MKTEQFSMTVDGSLPGSKLTVYLEDTGLDGETVKPVILICPGGGYSGVSRREADPMALKFLSMGYYAAVLTYSCEPAVYPTALLEVAQSMKLIHEHAVEWNVDTEHIVIAGCSAGGHLAASLGVFWNEPWLAQAAGTTNNILKPAGMILCYPVITSGEYANIGSLETLLKDRYEELKEEQSLEKRVTEDTVPAFIWHTYADTCVPVENSILMVMSMKKYDIPVEFHMYPDGQHGLSTCEGLIPSDPGYGAQQTCHSWLELARTWLRNLTGG